MSKIILMVLFVIISGCIAKELDFAVFKIGDYFLKVPAKYLENKQNVSPWIESVKEQLDDERGMILLKFSHDELISNIPVFTKSKANDYSLVLLYDEPINDQFLANNIQEFIDKGLNNVKVNDEYGGYNIYLYSDSWYVVKGRFSDDKKQFIINKLLSSCDSSLFGVSCKFFARMNEAYFTYSLKETNLESRKEVEAFYRSKINGWIQQKKRQAKMD